MVVSIVRWRHLSKQVRQVQICTGNWLCLFVIPGHVVISKEVSKTDLLDHYWSFEQILYIRLVLKCFLRVWYPSNPYYIQSVWATNLDNLNDNLIYNWLNRNVTDANTLNVRPDTFPCECLFWHFYKHVIMQCNLVQFVAKILLHIWSLQNKYMTLLLLLLKPSSTCVLAFVPVAIGHIYIYKVYMISILPLLCVLVPGAPPGTAGPGRPPGRRGAPLQQRHQQSQLRPTRFHLSVHPSAVNGETAPSKSSHHQQWNKSKLTLI